MNFPRGVLSAIVVCVATVGAAHAQTPTPLSLAIHGSSLVYEATAAEYRAVVSWSDGTQSSVSASWTSSWTSANPASLFMTPVGSFSTLITGDVAENAALTIDAVYSGPTGPISASKTVTVIDASAFPSVSYTLAPAWNLLGNSIGSPLNIVAMFGDPTQPVPGVTDAVISVWKWDAVNAKWAFFSPLMTPTQLAAHAADRNYSVLAVVQPGEGFWVNATRSATLPARSGGAVQLAFGSVISGWNLLSIGQTVTPTELDTLLSEVPPALGTLAQSFVSLWAWDANEQRWVFYAPSLDASGGSAAVKSYADTHGYLDFATLDRRLGHGIGFWVNSATANQNSDLAPLGQAKAMFSELRTTVRAYSNDLKSGFLDVQSTRVSDDLQNKVAPALPWVLQQYVHRLSTAQKLFDDIRDGQTGTYFVQSGTVAGTVRAAQFFFSGSVQVSCVSNDMAGTLVTPALLTSTSCTALDLGFGAYSYSFPNRTQDFPVVVVMAGATANDFTYQAIKYQRLETWNGSFYQFVSNTQIGPTRTGSLSRTYLAGTRNLSSFSIAGDLPPRTLEADRDSINLTGTRTLLDAANNLYRSSVSGSIVSKNIDGAAMITLTLASGSYFDSKQDADGNPLPDSMQAVRLVGTAETGAWRFTGVLDLNAFARDADNAKYVPTSLAFDGSFEDLSPSGAGIFLTGRFTVTLNNAASYHSLLLDTESNFLRVDTAFVGTIRAPSRPEMRLTTGSSRMGLDTFSFNVIYAYGSVSVTGTGTIDTLISDNSTLTLFNQDGVTVSFRPHADAVVAKDGVTLGTIPYGSNTVYFIDGYFESL